jgi:hypothetical protein
MAKDSGRSVSNHVVGNVGMYYAAYRLSQQGWNVMPTARNARGVDLLAYDVNAHIYKGIQVKALSNRENVRLGNTLEKFLGDWWIIVNNVGTPTPSCFILKPTEVKKLARRGKKDAPVSYWLQPNQYDIKKFREAWNRIGRGDSG